MRWLFAVGLGGCANVLGLSSIEPPPECPLTYQTIEGGGPVSSYRYFQRAVTWAEAEADCENDAPGDTHLVVFDSTDELVAVRQLVTDVTSYNLFVGYARNFGDDPFVFYAVTGETVESGTPEWYLWQAGEPNNFNGIETITFIESVATMRDGEPTRTERYICECDGRPVTRTFQLQ